MVLTEEVVGRMVLGSQQHDLPVGPGTMHPPAWPLKRRRRSLAEVFQGLAAVGAAQRLIRLLPLPKVFWGFVQMYEMSPPYNFCHG